ncbi:MAG: ACP S-malonyltransferase [bacterium]|nr:ACP S-malonyltransferase [bacterium]
MSKMVFVFPGVGSHYVGMGKNVYDNYKVVRDTFEEAGDILEMDMVKMCFEASEKEELDKLENSQAAILMTSIAFYRVYREEVGILPHYCMGHSLGEYSALCAAGVIRFPDALRLVHQRGIIIKDVSASLDGTMMWVINLPTATVEETCAKMAEAGEDVFISAYDSPTQLSISGSNAAVMKTAKQLETEGAIVYPLKMSGPFHSPLMEKAAQEMKALLETFEYNEPVFPVIANRNAQPYEGAGSVVENLSKQLVSPIRWQASIEYLSGQGVNVALEVGPKDVLKFLIKKISTNIRPLSMDKETDFNDFKENLVLREDEFLHSIGRCLGVATGTRNNNDNNDEYDELVIKPYRVIESLYQQLGSEGKVPTEKQVREAMETLRGILAAKKVPVEQHDGWIDRALGGKLLNMGTT